MQFLGVELNPTTDLIVGRDAVVDGILSVTGAISGGTITSLNGNVGIEGAANVQFILSSTDLQEWQIGYNAGSDIFGIYDVTEDAWAAYFDNGTRNMTVVGNLTVNGSISASNLSGSNTGDGGGAVAGFDPFLMIGM